MYRSLRASEAWKMIITKNSIYKLPNQDSTGDRMNAAIQLVNQTVVEDEHFEKQFKNVSLFEQAPEQKLRRALSYIMQLQAEIRMLREELARSERAAVHCEQLLRNATVRELELRAQLVKEVYR
jgi:hypothetical protein